MTDRSIVVRLRAEVAGFKASLASAKKSVDDLTKADIQKPARAFESMANKAAIAGAAVAFGVGKAVVGFTNFDSAMSGASAALPGATAKMDDLRAMAIDLGKDTQFSATEAAEGITAMAKAGVEAEEILGGGLAGALDLAAAGQLDVARASEIAATATKQFNLEGSDVAHVADLYAAAAGKALGSVEDIAQAMKFAGINANSMGVSIEETTGVIALFASKGIIGEQAGTSFRSMLLSLTAPSKLAQKAMSDLGINVFDASGNFVGLEGAAEQLRTKLGPLDEATRTAALGQIFGNESIGAAIALYEAGGSGVADWTAKVNDAGFAADQAAKLTDNLKGDMERLSGSIETVFIQAGSGANGSLRTLAQAAGFAVDSIGRIPGPLLLAGAGFTALALIVPKGLISLRAYKAQLDALGFSLDKVSAKAPKTAAALRAVGAAGTALAVLTVAGSGLEGMWLDVAGANDDATKSLAVYLEKGAEAEELSYLMKNGFGDLGGSIEHAFGTGGARGQILGFFDEVGTGFGIFGPDKLTEATTFFTQIDAGLAGLATSGNAEGAREVFEQIATEAQRQGISLDQVKEKLPQYATAIAAAGDESKIAAPKIGEASDEVKDIKKAAEDAKTKLDDLTATIEGFGSPLAAQRAAQRDYADAVTGVKESLASQRDEILKNLTATAEAKNGDKSLTDAQLKSLEKLADAHFKTAKKLDLTTEAGRNNQAALDGIRDKALAAATSTFTLTNSSKLAADEVKRGRADFIAAAIQMDLNSTEANTLADNMKLIPKDIESTIALSGVPEADASLDKTTGKVTTLDKAEAKPDVKAVIDEVSFGNAGTRLDRLAAERTAVISVQVAASQNQIDSVQRRLQRSGADFDTGGYTGNISPKAIAGNVHGDEHVIKSPSRRKFEAANPGTLDYINRYGALPPGYEGGGRVGSILPVRMPTTRGAEIDYGRLAAAILDNAPATNIHVQGNSRDAVALAAQLDWLRKKAR